MDAGVLQRFAIAAGAAAGSLALTLALVLSADARSGDPVGPELLPDLVVERPNELYIAGKKVKRLRVSNTVSNKGNGPLEITGDGSECEIPGVTEAKRTMQRVYNDDLEEAGSLNFFWRAHDKGWSEQEAGCSRFHLKHNHWHFDNFARYTLLSERTGKVVAGSRKVSFCVIDTGRPHPDLPGSPDDPYYPKDPGAPFASCSKTSVDGLSIGWEDTYGASLPGQGLKVTGRRRGRYCLRLETDPEKVPGDGGVLEELSENNNTRTVRLRLRVGRGVVKRLGKTCNL